MTWGKSLLLTIPLILSGIFVVPSPASASTRIGSQSDWTTVSSGGSHTCAIRAGRLFCWGSNDSGQVGNGDGGSAGDDWQSVPDRIGGATDWRSVSAGGAHTCGIRAGQLYCWGNDDDQQLGNGSSGSKNTPYRISSATNWKMVTAGRSHTCAIRGSGLLACWGSDEQNQVGTGGVSPSVPTRVSNARWKTVSAGGSHTCGIPSINSLACWGNDDDGQVGNGSGGAPSKPARVSNAFDWKSVSSGGAHSCAVRTGGNLACWGRSERGQVGDGETADQIAPKRITGYLDWRSVSAGTANTCAIRGTGALYCWGDNIYGQTTGTASTTPRLAPLRRYSAVADFKVTDAGGRLSCGVRKNGKLYCWGDKQLAPSCPALKPWSNPDTVPLNYWKLTLPVDGLDSGTTADEIKQPALDTYHNEPQDWFTAEGASRIFYAPTTGATTSENTPYTRSELREMTPWNGSSYSSAGWSNASGRHVMEINQKILELPDGPDDKVVAGQIHDGKDDVVRILLDGSRLYADFNDGEFKKDLDTGYTLGEEFALRIQADPCGVRITYKGVLKANLNVVEDESSWYFKAGVYTINNTPGDGGGRVQINGLKVTHEN